ncbi:plasmid mobilization protein [Collimonas pratensis]|uniref:plasmid mobilization protein n=1 Tax=Collimonas pratensis TaxID=279113 RepID=UPI000ADCFF58
MAIDSTERIVVQVTSKEKKAIVEKAKKLGVPVSKLMRRGARTYKSEAEDYEVGVVAGAAKAAVRACIRLNRLPPDIC